jgi:hypothetical protein
LCDTRLGAAALSFPTVFYDIEASVVQGVPIEIGGAFAELQTGNIQVESRVIRPLEQWHIPDVWDEVAAQIQDISLDQLYAYGRSPANVVQCMN